MNPTPRRPGRATLLATGALLLGSLACSGLVPEPVPEDRMDYVGTWTGGPVTLRIEPSGNVHYEKSSGRNSAKIEAPIQAWHATGFDVGLGPITTTFVVDAPPQQEGGVWTMTVDGQALQRR